MFSAQITTEPACVVTCPEGHRFVLRLHDEPHALLFERALQRVAQGVTRDAVVDAYTALEMYVAHVPRRARVDREPGLRLEDLDRDLKHIRPSQRAWGAAIAVASLVSAGPPPVVNSKIEEARNKAVHAGVYPSVADAEWVCSEVEKTVRAFEACLDVANGESDYFGQLSRLQFAKWLAAHPEIHGLNVTQGTVSPTLTRKIERSSQPTTRERLAALRSDPAMQVVQ